MEDGVFVTSDKIAANCDMKMIPSSRLQIILAILMTAVTKTTGFIAIPGPTRSRFESKASPPSLYIREEESFGLPILNNITDSVRRNNTSTTAQRVTTLIFDVDDTLYDISCGFKKHRNGKCYRPLLPFCSKFET